MMNPGKPRSQLFDGGVDHDVFVASRFRDQLIMNKTMLRAIAGATVAAIGLGSTAAYAAPVSASATARAQILRQITLTNTSDLDFGTIVSGAAGSTVVVTGAGARTCGAGLTCTGTTTGANFNIVGTNNAVVTVTGSNSVSLTSGANTMSASLVRSGTAVTLSATGTGSVQVGGTLTVGATQADGAYTGTFSVTVDYQ
jgi:Mat/Ecp fimbriae major subunit